MVPDCGVGLKALPDSRQGCHRQEGIDELPHLGTVWELRATGALESWGSEGSGGPGDLPALGAQERGRTGSPLRGPFLVRPGQ